MFRLEPKEDAMISLNRTGGGGKSARPARSPATSKRISVLCNKPLFRSGGVLFALWLSLSTLAQGASLNLPTDARVVEGATGREMNLTEMVSRISAEPALGQVVLGEKHDTPAVQEMQGAVIHQIVLALHRQNDFSVGWEFLNSDDQALIHSKFEEYRAGKITSNDFLSISQGGTYNASYVPIFEVTRDLGGEMIGTNLTREEKAPVVQGGMAAEDPRLVPPGFELGGPNYYRRFVDVMSGDGHATPAQMANYFAAQCLTDDVIAYHLLNDSSMDLRFLIVGGFHTDYREGVIHRLEVRDPLHQTVLVRVIDASDYTKGELEKLREDPVYGVLADYIIFVNQPAPSR